jgi:hypothetical protein
MAMGTATAEKKPAENRDILYPRNLMLAKRAEGPGRAGYGDAPRDAVDADVQE